MSLVVKAGQCSIEPGCRNPKFIRTLLNLNRLTNFNECSIIKYMWESVWYKVPFIYQTWKTRVQKFVLATRVADVVLTYFHIERWWRP